MKLIVAILLALCFFPLPQPVHAQTVAGPITNTANGHLYYLVGPTWWTNAEAQAVRLGGHLVTINDAEENAWVLASFGNFSGPLQALHIGFTDQGHEGRWDWVSGEPVTYTHWNAREPNNGMGVFPYENLAVIYGPGDTRVGFWNDMLGTLAEQRYYGVVEVLPKVSLRVSEVELCWPSLTGVIYQVQYRSSLTANSWVNFGPPTNGTGSAIYLKDPVPNGEPQRFYRVITN